MQMCVGCMLQMEKIKNGIAAMSGDVVGVIEIANDGFDASSTGGLLFHISIILLLFERPTKLPDS